MNILRTFQPPHARPLRWLSTAVFLLLLLLTVGPPPASTAQTDDTTHNVLILNSHQYGMPWQTAVNEAIMNNFALLSDKQIQYKVEYLDLAQHTSDAYIQNLLTLYQDKYQDQPFDAIIAIDAPAIDFVIEHGSALFGDVPLVFLADITPEQTGQLPMAGVLASIGFTQTIDLARQLHPDAQHIAVIGGAAPLDREYTAEIWRSLAPYEEQYSFIDLTGLPMAEITAVAAQLPPQTIIFYSTTIVDGAGEAFIPREVVADLAAVANAPIYSFWDTLLGQGIVGGYLSSTEAMGAQVVQMTLEILAGAEPADIPINNDIFQYMFDWQMMTQWQINPNQLPAGAIIVNREFSFWEMYSESIIIASLVIVLQSFWILILFHNRRQLTEAQRTLAQSHQALETKVAERTAALRTSETRYRQLADNAPLPVAVTALHDGQLLYTNQKAAQLFDTTVKSSLKSRASDYYLDPTQRQDVVQRLTTQGILTDFEFQMQKASRQPLWISLTAHLSTYENQPAIHATFLDITERKQMENALRFSEEQFRSAFQSAAHGIALVSPTGHFLQVNQAYCDIVGYSSKEMLALDFQTITHPDDLDIDLAYVQQLLVGEIDKYHMEKRYFHKSGRLIWVLLSGALTRDEEGDPIHFIAQVIDITQRKEMEISLEEKNEELEQFFAAALDLLCIADTDGRFLRLNKEWENTLGYTLAELENHSFLDLIHPDDLQPTREALAALSEQNSVFNFTNRYRTKEGRYRLIEWRSQPRGQLIHASARDITERKQAQEALQAAILEAQELADRAESANQAKSEFLANMSHEIRTPMNGILGMTDLLLETDLDAEQRRYAQMAQSSGHALLNLINDILDFSKMEAGKLEIETYDFDLRHLMEEIGAILALPAHEKGLEFICALDPTAPFRLHGDADRLRQILLNLAGNAVKFTKSGEVVTHGAVVEEEEEAVLIRFTVRDSGIGIPADKIDQLFNKFMQVDSSTTRRHGGTGLGLAIVRQLVALMGGEIGVASQPNEGSEFWFTLRLEKQSEATRGQTAPVADLAGVRALIVDDNAASREVLLAWLALWGMRPTAVDNAPTALSTLQQAQAAHDPFQLALIDMQILGMDGESLGRVIKADERLANTAVALLTSLSHHHDRHICQEIGFAACLSKPVRHEELRQTLIQMLTGQTRRDTAVSQPDKQTTITDNPSSPPFARHDARILLAEDNPTNQQVALAILQKLGLTAETAENGRDAWHMAAARPYDLILMDLQMPDMDGLEATRRLRVAGQQAPIIALTAYAMPGDREKCLAAGMNDYLSKPISPAALRQTLNQWLPHLSNPSDFAPPDDVPTENNGNNTAVWDRAGMLARLMGDEELLSVIAAGFVTDISQQIEKLRGQLAADDGRGAARQAHTIKGAAANVGGERLRAAARQLEEAATQGDRQTAQSWLAELETEFSHLRDMMVKK